MSYGCFVVECSNMNVHIEGTKRITSWNPVRMSPSVCCFVKHMIENQNEEIPSSFEFLDLPSAQCFNKANVTRLSSFSNIPIPWVEPFSNEDNSLFSIYGQVFLQKETENPHTILHSTCCYCGSHLCLKNHYDFKFFELIQRKNVWHNLYSDVMFSEPCKTKLHFNNQDQTLIFMVDFIYKCCIVYNTTQKKAEFCYTFPPRLNRKLTTVYKPKNPLSLATYCFQTMWLKDIDWKKTAQVIPERMLQFYPLYNLYEAINMIAGEGKKNYLQESRNYYRELKKHNLEDIFTV